MTPLEVGLAGTGAFAARTAEAIASSPDVRLTSVCSRDPERARAFAAEHGGVAYADVAEMARASQAVIIAGATGRHEPDSLAALATGTPVLCEKPMATTQAGVQRVVDAAREAGTFLIEGYWTCHLPAWQAAKARVRSGQIGTPQRLRADFGIATPREEAPRVWSEDDGVLRDRGVYVVCLALWTLGPATLREADVTRRDGIDAEASLILDHEDGAVSHLRCSMLRTTANHGVIEGSEGGLTLRTPLLGSTSLADRADRTRDAGMGNKLVRKTRTLAGRIGAERHPYGADQYHPQLAHLARQIRDGASQSSVVPHALSLGGARIIDEARAA